MRSIKNQPRGYQGEGAAIWDHARGEWVKLDDKELERRWPKQEADAEQKEPAA